MIPQANGNYPIGSPRGVINQNIRIPGATKLEGPVYSKVAPFKMTISTNRGPFVTGGPYFFGTAVSWCSLNLFDPQTLRDYGVVNKYFLIKGIDLHGYFTLTPSAIPDVASYMQVSLMEKTSFPTNGLATINTIGFPQYYDEEGILTPGNTLGSVTSRSKIVSAGLTIPAGLAAGLPHAIVIDRQWDCENGLALISPDWELYIGSMLFNHTTAANMSFANNQARITLRGDIIAI